MASRGGRNRDFIARLIEFGNSRNGKQNLRNTALVPHQSWFEAADAARWVRKRGACWRWREGQDDSTHSLLLYDQPISTAFGIQGKEKSLDRGEKKSGSAVTHHEKKIWIGSRPPAVQEIFKITITALMLALTFLTHSGFFFLFCPC